MSPQPRLRSDRGALSLDGAFDRVATVYGLENSLHSFQLCLEGVLSCYGHELSSPQAGAYGAREGSSARRLPITRTIEGPGNFKFVTQATRRFSRRILRIMSCRCF